MRPATALMLSEEQKQLRDTVEALARDHFSPKAAEWDRHRTVLPDAERKLLAELDLLGITHLADVGGSDRPLMDALIVIEELAKHAPSAAFPVFESNTGPARVVDLLGTAEQRERFLPPVIRGEVTIAVSISEPEAGSAATDIRTTARVTGDEVVINGTKRWCTGAGHAEQYLVYARIDTGNGEPKIGAVILDRDAPGLSFGERERLMGFRTVPSADMYFDDVRVPKENVIVEGGFGKLFEVFSIERLGNATMSLAVAQACLDRTAVYITQRRQFGRELADFQLVQAALADMVMEVEAARLLIHRAAERAGRGTPSPLETSIAKCYANEMAKRVTDLGMQLHGGYGYSEEYEIERLHRDAHGWALAGGTPNMQRIRIASSYLGRRFDQRGQR
jgi:alkylation response protein AidB-like acyl-CoA dehydrogenase